MSAELKMLFFGVAIVLFIIAAVTSTRRRGTPDLNLGMACIAGGLACATFPFFWDALDVATA